MERRTHYFSGSVQGVGFRYTARQVAAGYPVTGFVRNLDDGQVELVIEGAPDALSGVLQGIQDQMGHNIRRTTTDAGPATGEFKGFLIRH